MDVKNSPFVKEQTTLLAADLARYADRPVRIELKGGPHLQTAFGADSRQALRVVLDPGILAKVRNEETACTIWRAIAFFQLQRLLTPAVEQLKSAEDANCRPVFLLLNDEHDERCAMSRDANLGSLFQSLTGYVYRSATRQRSDGITEIAGGSANGGGSCAAYFRRVNEFAYYLRRHLPTSDNVDAVVAEALAYVPDDLKELSKDQVLQLALQVQTILARDVAVPKKTVVEPIQAVLPLDEAAGDEVAEDAAVEDPILALNPVDPRWWQVVLGSRWSYITLFTAVLVWLVVCLSFGVNFWLGLFWTGSVGSAVALLAGAVAVRNRYRTRRENDGTRAPRLPRRSLGEILFGWLPFRVQYVGGFQLSFGVLVGALAGLLVGLVLSGIGLLPLAIIGGAIGAFASLRWEAICRGATCTWEFLIDGVWTSFTNLCRRGWANVRGFVLDRWDGICETKDRFWRSALMIHLRAGLVSLICGFGAWCSRTVFLLWRNPSLRLVIVALPIAMVLATVYAVAFFSTKLMLWQLVMMVGFWVVMLGLTWVYRKAIKRFLLVDMFNDEEVDHDVACTLPVDKTTTGFSAIETVIPVNADAGFVERTAAEVLEAARVLSDSLTRIGITSAEKDYCPEGDDLIDELELVLAGEVNVLVAEKPKRRMSLAIDVLIDCSDSQTEPTSLLARGQKFQRSKMIALALEAAVRGKRGVSLQTWGFTASEIYDCGSAGGERASGLQTAGGNNDAAALWHASQSLLSRPASVRAIVIVSDMQPADCSWGALNALGWQLTQDGIVVIQVAVDSNHDAPLPWNVVDLHSKPLLDAAGSLGRIFESSLIAAV
ncbi:MAG: hypothetical protein K2W82_16680 [Candidatus Obscuribacterales bacterium]|nr:hypothetical protein [Candidatus Obscuribacterales bacterium]